MKILAVCSTINFRDFTRRATIEAIKKEIETLDVLLFTSLKNFFKKKTTVKKHSIQYVLFLDSGKNEEIHFSELS